MESVVVKTVAVALAGSVIRQLTRRVLPVAALTLGAALAVRATPTVAVEGLLLALVLARTGLGNYFPFNFIVLCVGGAGIFSIVYELTVQVETWQRRRRAQRSRRAGADADELDAKGRAQSEQPEEPVGLLVLVVGSLLYSVLGAVPQLGGALLG